MSKVTIMHWCYTRKCYKIGSWRRTKIWKSKDPQFQAVSCYANNHNCLQYNGRFHVTKIIWNAFNSLRKYLQCPPNLSHPYYSDWQCRLRGWTLGWRPKFCKVTMHKPSKWNVHWGCDGHPYGRWLNAWVALKRCYALRNGILKGLACCFLGVATYYTIQQYPLLMWA